MAKLVYRLPLGLLALLAAGCVDVEEEFTLNPDGSGKVIVRWAYAPVDVKVNGAQEAGPEELAHKAVRAEIEKSEGVECWKDVSYKVRDDGKVAFQGTAYFKDFAKLKIHAQGMSLNFMAFSCSKDDQGNLILGAAEEKKEEKKEKPPAPKNDGEMKKRLLEERFSYQQSRAILQAYLADAKFKTTFHLPGAVGPASCFTKSGERSVELDFEGKKLLKAIDGLMMDDARLRKELERGFSFKQSSTPFEEIFGEALFGTKGPIQAATHGALKPSFEFEKEVNDEACKAYEKLRETLGVGQVAAPAPALIAPIPPLLARPHRAAATPTERLREQFTLDLSAPEILRASNLSGDDAIKGLRELLSEANYSYSIESPDQDTSSTGGPEKGRLRLLLSGKEAERRVEELEARGPGSRSTRLILRQRSGDKVAEILVENDSRKMVAILIRRSDQSVQLALLEDGSGLVRAWTSMSDALRENPLEMGGILEALRFLPMTLAPTPASPDVIRLSLRWAEELEEGVKKRLAALHEQLADDDPTARDLATANLKKEVAGDPLRVRLLLSWLAESANAETRGRLEEIVDTQRTIADAVRTVRDLKLDRDLRYLGSLLATPEKESQAAAHRRLAAIAGREFPTRAAFDAWYGEHREKLVWDEKARRYRLRE